MIYALPDQESGIMYGVVLTSLEREALETLAAVAEHMLSTLHVD
jgi:hypothetical protein